MRWKKIYRCLKSILQDKKKINVITKDRFRDFYPIDSIQKEDNMCVIKYTLKL